MLVIVKNYKYFNELQKAVSLLIQKQYEYIDSCEFNT